MATFFEQYTRYCQFMTVLAMSPEQVQADPRALATLREIIDVINSDPDEPMGVGLRKQVERILGPQQWKQQGDVR